jgi:hypothetical protein
MAGVQTRMPGYRIQDTGYSACRGASAVHTIHARTVIIVLDVPMVVLKQGFNKSE